MPPTCTDCWTNEIGTLPPLIRGQYVCPFLHKNLFLGGVLLNYVKRLGTVKYTYSLIAAQCFLCNK